MSQAQPVRLKRILLAVDGSDHSWAAVNLLSDLPFSAPASAGEARGWDGKVTVATVLLPRDAAFYNQRRSALEQSANLLKEKGIEVETEFITGYPVEALNNLASEMEPDLFVLGAKGLRASLNILVGGVAQQIVEYASWPVLVVRAPYHGVKTALLALDGSASSQAALDYLCSFPLPPQTNVKVLHVLPPVYSPEVIAQRYPVMPEALIPFPMLEQADLEWAAEEEEKEAWKLVNQAVRQLNNHQIEAEACVLRGDAGSEILDFARQHQMDLLVSGSRGLSPVKSFLLGSVSRKLVHYAHASVLVVKNK